jgi:PAS domain S-box-containing protein
MNEYKSFYENSPIAFWRTSIDGGQFLMANLACAKLLGHDSVDTLLQDNSIHLYVNGDRKHILDELTANGEINDYHVELVLGNGKHIWVSVTGKVYPEEGYIEGSLTDVTALKVMEDRMAIETKKLSIIQEGMKQKIKELSVALHKA